MYCEHCGMEIQIVPDFEPEIENSISETLNTLAEELTQKEEKEKEEEIQEDDFIGEDAHIFTDYAPDNDYTYEDSLKDI